MSGRVLLIAGTEEAERWLQPRIVLLDAGMVTRMSGADQQNPLQLFRAFTQKDGQGVAKAILQFSGSLPACLLARTPACLPACRWHRHMHHFQPLASVSCARRGPTDMCAASSFCRGNAAPLCQDAASRRLLVRGPLQQRLRRPLSCAGPGPPASGTLFPNTAECAHPWHTCWQSGLDLHSLLCQHHAWPGYG